jgi:peptide chain release factor subunit 1
LAEQEYHEMAENEARRNEFQRTLHALESAGGPGQELITLYIPPDKPIAEVTGYLNEEYTRSGAIRDTGQRMLTEQALSSALSSLKNYAALPENGLALFCQAGTGTDPSCTVIEPPEPLPLYLYRRSSKFALEPLQQMLEAKNVYGLLVLDLSGAWWGILRGGRVKSLGSSTSNIHGRQRKGGQSAARFQRLREIAVNEFFTRVGNHASETFLREQDFRQRFAGVLIGGQSPTKEEFSAGNFLHHEIRQRVIGLFDVTWIDERGLAELAENAKDVIRGLNIAGEEEILDRFRNELPKDGGLAAYGEESIRKNLAAGAVGVLLLSAGLRKSRNRITCQECGHTHERTISLEPGITVPDILVHTCRVCAAPIIEDGAVDIIEELTHLADQSGAKTQIISENFPEGTQFRAEFGGMGAILRYRTGF